MCTVIPLSLSEIAAVTNGRLHGARGTEVVTAVEFDSRAIRPGGLFLALPGERVDGHDFAAAAVERGAVAVLAAREVDGPAVGWRPPLKCLSFMDFSWNAVYSPGIGRYLSRC